MMRTLRQIANQYNSLGMVATTFALGVGTCLSLVVTALSVYAAGGNAVSVTVACTIVSVLTLIGCVTLLALEWINPSCEDENRTLLSSMVMTALAAFFMPIVVFIVLFVLCTWKMLLRLYARIVFLFRGTKPFEEINNALHSH